jgi:hypothetical protein
VIRFNPTSGQTRVAFANSCRSASRSDAPL